jgi:hypothetical protein
VSLALGRAAALVLQTSWMDTQTAFLKLWASEGNAGRAATLLSHALVVQLAGWEGVRLNRSRVNDLRRVLAGAAIEPAAIRFFAEDDPRWVKRNRLTGAEIETLRVEQEQEFAMLAHNMRGHLYKKTEWRDYRDDPGDPLPGEDAA